MDGRTVTGGTGRTVKTAHSGRATSGSIPRSLRSSSGIRSKRSRMSAEVNFCSVLMVFPVFSSTTEMTSTKEVGFSKLILYCCSPQYGQTRSFLTSFSPMVSAEYGSSSKAENFSISSLSRSSLPQSRQVIRSSFLIKRVYPTWITGFARSM